MAIVVVVRSNFVPTYVRKTDQPTIHFSHFGKSRVLFFPRSLARSCLFGQERKKERVCAFHVRVRTCAVKDGQQASLLWPSSSKGKPARQGKLMNNAGEKEDKLKARKEKEAKTIVSALFIPTFLLYFYRWLGWVGQQSNPFSLTTYNNPLLKSRRKMCRLN